MGFIAWYGIKSVPIIFVRDLEEWKVGTISSTFKSTVMLVPINSGFSVINTESYCHWI